jgi:hypothetical protein
MNVESSGAEQDAGTLYPSLMEDSNGNQIVCTYGPAIGWGGTNTSARITGIADSRGTGGNTYGLGYTYSPGALPHLTGISGPSGTNENYSLTVALSNSPIQDPFAHASYGYMYLLSQIASAGMNTSNLFTSWNTPYPDKLMGYLTEYEEGTGSSPIIATLTKKPL